MKVKNNFSIFLLFICLCHFVSATAAQQNPQAVVFYKFDTNEIENSKLLTKKLKEFIFRLSKEPETTRGFISIAGNTKLAEEIKLFVANNSNLASQIIFNWNLKYPNAPINFFDFYLVPLGAEIPYVEVHEPCECPTLDIIAFATATDRNSLLIFTAEVKGKTQSEFKYLWNISTGKIVEGQGTNIIKVDAQGSSEVTATVRFSGSCDDDTCPRVTSEIIKIP